MDQDNISDQRKPHDPKAKSIILPDELIVPIASASEALSEKIEGLTEKDDTVTEGMGD